MQMDCGRRAEPAGTRGRTPSSSAPRICSNATPPLEGGGKTTDPVAAIAAGPAAFPWHRLVTGQVLAAPVTPPCLRTVRTNGRRDGPVGRNRRRPGPWRCGFRLAARFRCTRSLPLAAARLPATVRRSPGVSAWASSTLLLSPQGARRARPRSLEPPRPPDRIAGATRSAHGRLPHRSWIRGQAGNRSGHSDGETAVEAAIEEWAGRLHRETTRLAGRCGAVSRKSRAKCRTLGVAEEHRSRRHRDCPLQGIGHGERQGDCDAGVDGIPAGPQDLEPHLCRPGVRARPPFHVRRGPRNRRRRRGAGPGATCTEQEQHAFQAPTVTMANRGTPGCSERARKRQHSSSPRGTKSYHAVGNRCQNGSRPRGCLIRCPTPRMSPAEPVQGDDDAVEGAAPT